MVRGYDRAGLRFAIWVGVGRDPEIAYLDATQLVIGGAELTLDGWTLFDKGDSYNVLGGMVEGPIDPAVLHRISHAVVDRGGKESFEVGRADCRRPAAGELCEVALREPLLAVPYHERGAFYIDADFALQWVNWGDPGRERVLRRAVYMDDTFLMEAGVGRDGKPRIWPARGLAASGLELVVPSAKEAGVIESRVSRATNTNPIEWS
jgi:hypothetical protein